MPMAHPPTVPQMQMGSTPPQRRESQSALSIDWSLPQTAKLKYSQAFNTLDKNRVGALTGIHARNVMSQSGLPTTVLAQIWGLSDLNKDGMLSCEEFCICMHLLEMAKVGIDV